MTQPQDQLCAWRRGGAPKGGVLEKNRTQSTQRKWELQPHPETHPETKGSCFSLLMLSRACTARSSAPAALRGRRLPLAAAAASAPLLIHMGTCRTSKRLRRDGSVNCYSISIPVIIIHLFCCLSAASQAWSPERFSAGVISFCRTICLSRVDCASGNEILLKQIH